MLTKFQKVGAAMLATTIAAALTSIAPASATSAQTKWTHSACEGANVACGVILMGNAGGFTLEWVSLTARDSQPGGPATHPECPSVDKKIKDDVPSGNYDQFTVPASCAYKLKVQIKSGSKKDQNLYLTPGCKIVASVNGTTTSNSWRGNDVEPLNDNVPTKEGKPVDAMGYKCGKQSSAGF